MPRKTVRTEQDKETKWDYHKEPEIEGAIVDVLTTKVNVKPLPMINESEGVPYF